MEEAGSTIDEIHKTAADETKKKVYTKEDHDNDLTITYVQTGFKLVKLYLPAALVCGASVYCILKSNSILRKRNAALATAYAALKTDFGGYRSRVVERFGEQVDKELKYNIKTEQVEETVVDKETGEEKTVIKTLNVVDSDLPNPYARWFDPSCNGWEDNSDYGMLFLRGLQKMMNDKLIARGHLFLNEVYDEFGIPRTEEGQYVGWVYDRENPMGDNFVDFDPTEVDRRTEDGYERCILLNFNCDGNIMAQMKKRPHCFRY